MFQDPEMRKRLEEVPKDVQDPQILAELKSDPEVPAELKGMLNNTLSRQGGSGGGFGQQQQTAAAAGAAQTSSIKQWQHRP